MRIFKSKVFNRFARKAALDDRALREAINLATAIESGALIEVTNAQAIP
jgi:hypothetical protein